MLLSNSLVTKFCLIACEIVIKSIVGIFQIQPKFYFTMKRVILFPSMLILIFSFSCSSQKGTTNSSEWKSDTYSDTTIRGWTVHVNMSLKGHEFQLNQTYTRLNSELSYVENQMPAASIGSIKEIPCWLEFHSRNGQILQYHRSAQWLSLNGFNPAKVNSIEI